MGLKALIVALALVSTSVVASEYSINIGYGKTEVGAYNDGYGKGERYCHRRQMDVRSHRNLTDWFSAGGSGGVGFGVVVLVVCH